MNRRLRYVTEWQLAAPFMAPVLRWNHEGVMRSGGRGLARHLAARPALQPLAG